MYRIYPILFLCFLWACGTSIESTATDNIRLPGETRAANALPALDSLADQLRICMELSEIAIKRSQDQNISTLASTILTQSQDLYKDITDATIKHQLGVSYQLTEAKQKQILTYRVLAAQSLDEEYLSLMYQHLLEIDQHLDEVSGQLPADLQTEIQSTVDNHKETVAVLI